MYAFYNVLHNKNTYSYIYFINKYKIIKALIIILLYISPKNKRHIKKIITNIDMYKKVENMINMKSMVKQIID